MISFIFFYSLVPKYVFVSKKIGNPMTKHVLQFKEFFLKTKVVLFFKLTVPLLASFSILENFKLFSVMF